MIAYIADTAARNSSQPPRGRTSGQMGLASVYKLSGNRKRPWVASRDRRLLGSFTTKAEAERFLSKLEKKSISDKWNFTFEQAYTAWNSSHFSDLTPTGINSYEYAYKRLSHLAKRPAREIRTSDYQQVIDEMAGEGLSRISVTNVRMLARQISLWMMREDLIDKNYGELIRIPKTVRKTQKKAPFTDAEISFLWKFAFEENDGELTDCARSAQIILLLIYTGMRGAELFEMKKNNVHLNERHMIGGVKTEKGKNRVIPFPAKIAPIVESLYANTTGELLMSGYQGRNRGLENFKKRDYVDCLDRLKISANTMHATRNTFASLSVRAGIKPELLQEIIGHEEYTTTLEFYNKNRKEDLISAIDALNNY